MKTKKSIYLKDDLIKKLEELSDKESRSFNSMVEYIISQYLKDK